MSKQYFDHTAKPKRFRSTPVRLPRSQMNMRELTKAQAYKLGPSFYEMWKEFKRNELQRLIEWAKELRNQLQNHV